MGQPDKRYEAELLIALGRAVLRMNMLAMRNNIYNPNAPTEATYKDAEEWLRKVNSDRNEEGNEDPSKVK